MRRRPNEREVIRRRENGADVLRYGATGVFVLCKVKTSQQNVRAADRAGPW